MAEETITLTIDDVEVTVPKGTTVFEAAKSVGIDIPHFCYHPELSIAGCCRMCLVEIEKMPKLATSCSTVAGDGMVVRTPHTSDRVREAVRGVLELTFINHPIDCPICDQAGECKLQEYYWEWGLYGSRLRDKKVTNPKHTNIGPMVVLDADRCILCSRCVRFCREVPKTEELCIINRGDHAEIALGTGQRLENAYSANVVDICPVGAHTLRDFRFACRVWYLKHTDSVCPGCARGCSVRIDHHEGRIYRLKPRNNPEVNGAWMCDYGRTTYKLVHDEKRIEAPMVRDAGSLEEVTWERALEKAAAILKEAGAAVIGLGSPHATNEEIFLFGKLLEAVKAKSVGAGTTWDAQGEEDELLRRADLSPNREGAIRILGESTLADDIDGAKAAIILTHDPKTDAPADVASKLGKLTKIVLASHLHATAMDADVVLPIATFAEREGTMTNFEGQTQVVNKAVEAPGESRAAVEVLAELIEGVGGKAIKKTDAASLFDELAKAFKPFKGLKFAKLGELGAGKTEEGKK
jgi:NADH-quinone oxidoreductase subunit G